VIQIRSEKRGDDVDTINIYISIYIFRLHWSDKGTVHTVQSIEKLRNVSSAATIRVVRRQI
jgi:hypothetical protein